MLLASAERLRGRRYRRTYQIRAHVASLDGSGAPVAVSSPGAERASAVRAGAALAGLPIRLAGIGDKGLACQLTWCRILLLWTGLEGWKVVMIPPRICLHGASIAWASSKCLGRGTDGRVHAASISWESCPSAPPTVQAMRSVVVQ